LYMWKSLLESAEAIRQIAAEDVIESCPRQIIEMPLTCEAHPLARQDATGDNIFRVLPPNRGVVTNCFGTRRTGCRFGSGQWSSLGILRLASGQTHGITS